MIGTQNKSTGYIGIIKDKDLERFYYEKYGDYTDEKYIKK